MVEAAGIVLMVVGALLVVSAVRGYALLSPRRRARARQLPGESFRRMLVGMLLLGALLVAVGYLMASRMAGSYTAHPQ